jgi:serine/threonine protein kinase
MTTTTTTTTLEQINSFYKMCKVVVEPPRFKLINGKFGKMSLLHHTLTSKMYLQKSISNRDFNSDEIKIHQMMENHDNFIKLFFYYGSMSGQHTLVMDYINCPDLFELLRSNDVTLTHNQIGNIVRQLCCALNDLHSSCGYIHNDVKLENVLYFEALNRVYVCDYGLCRPENTPSAHDGTVEYFSPEKIRRHNYARSFDWYAVGVLTYKLLSGGRHPFEKKFNEKFDVSTMKRRQRYDEINFLPDINSEKGRDFVFSLTRFDVTYRLTKFKHIIKHNFLLSKN